MNKIKVLVPDAEGGNIRQVIMCFSQMADYETYLVSCQKESFMRYSRYCKFFFANDETCCSNARLDKVVEVIKQCSIDIILPSSVPGFLFVYENFNLLNSFCKIILMPNRTNYEIAANKVNFYNFCVKNSFQTPKSLVVNSMDVFKEFDNLHFPVLLKPHGGDGGFGILEFSDRNSLKKYILENYEDLENNFLIQEFVTGRALCINVVCWKGKIMVYTVQRGVLPPARKYNFSRGIEFIEGNSVCEFMEPMFKKLDWSGIANVDLLYDEDNDQLYVLEINPRVWGTILASFNAGVKFLDLLIRKSLDVEFNSFPSNYRISQFAYLNLYVFKRILLRKFKVKASDTNLRFYLQDPIPTIMSKFYKMKNHYKANRRKLRV